MYYDINGVKAYDEMLNDKYENRKDPENVFPVGITDAEFRRAIIDIFCGVDWYISYPGSRTSKWGSDGIYFTENRNKKEEM